MAWYDNNWGYRVKITISASDISSDLTGFPVYVDLSELPAGFHTNVNSDGSDIRVTEADGETEIPREVVVYNAGSDTGELHFKGDVSSSIDTDFYIYYGNSSASDYAAGDTYGRNNVWTDYVAVYHLNEDPGATNMVDATGRGNDGTPQAGMDSGNVTAGKLGGNGLVFGGASNEFVLVSDDPDFDWGSSFTITAWGQTDNLTADGAIFAKNGGGTSEPLIWFDEGVDDFTLACVLGSFRNGSSGGSYTTRSINTWYFLAGKYDGSTMKMLVNDVQNYSVSDAGGVTTTNANIGIGAEAGNLRRLSGKIDEVRVANAYLNDARTSAEYLNQNSPATFISVGSEEELPTGSWLTGWDYRIKVTIASAEVDSDQSNFPVYVDLADLPSGFHTNVDSQGDDIRVTTDDGVTEVPIEIVDYNHINDTGELYFKGSISSSVDTDFYIYYGNVSASPYAEDATYGAENVWTNYLAVYHMNQNPATTNLKDSTANDKDGVMSGSMLGSDLVAGPNGGFSAIDFDGSNDQFTISDSTPKDFQSQSFTTEAFISIAESQPGSGSWGFFTSGSTGTGGSWGHGLLNSGDTGLGHYQDSGGAKNIDTDGDIADGTYRFLNFISSGSVSRQLVNGVQQTETLALSTLLGGSWDVYIGSWGGASNRFLACTIEELRFATSDLGNDYEAAISSNFNTPGTFYSIGTEETEGGATVDVTIDAKARVEKTSTATVQAKASILKTTSRSIEAKGKISIVNEATIQASANIKSTISRTIQSKGRIGLTAKTILVSPNDQTTAVTPITFVWEIPSDAQQRNIHFEIQIDDTNETFSSLEYNALSFQDSGFEYWNGSAWAPIDVTGVANTYYGNQARIEVSLTAGIKYWRVRGGVK